MTALLLALLATIVLETLVVSLILRRFVWLQSIAVQLVTWPVAQSLVSRGAELWLVELGVVLAEVVLWRYLARVPWAKAALLSLAANGLTAAISFAIAAFR